MYRHEMTEADHARLLETLLWLPCRVMVSSYWNEQYADALAGWRSFSFQATTRGWLATESVWCNFGPPAELHDYRFLGGNKRERERIRDKVQRWAEGLQRLPALERQAILAELSCSGRDISRPGTGE